MPDNANPVIHSSAASRRTRKRSDSLDLSDDDAWDRLARRTDGEDFDDDGEIEEIDGDEIFGLSIRVRLLRALPERYKVDIKLKKGSHQSENAVNKQLNDKERVAAALENQHLVSVLDAIDISVETIFDPKTCRRRGFCEVQIEGVKEEHRLYYELHGSDSPEAKRLVFVMGLNASSFAWEKQVAYFASLPNYSVLVFDNRGSGNSSSPAGPYSTQIMAQDAVALLDYIGWTGQRSLTVIGASLGGMISMDIARLIPERISSLVLASTKSGFKYNYPTIRTMFLMLRFLTGTVWTKKQSMRLTVGHMFPRSFLNRRDEEEGVKQGVITLREFERRVEMTKKAPSRGRMGQMAACFKHRMSAEGLAEIAANIPKISIITGDSDKIVRLADANILHKMLPGSNYKVCSGVGHGLTLQIANEFNQWLAMVIEEGHEFFQKATGNSKQESSAQDEEVVA
ncbi:hypothetical protein MNV49_003319 [Pseudohyphozyma bogoriensis]|nr:hypothetical protein MNV49_003319 [Pseudohyphozyma bogoriensis]